MWCDQRGDPSVGRWSELKRFVHEVGGFEVGRDCLEQTCATTGHAAGSFHYPMNGATAVDFGDSGVDHPAIARWLMPLAVGPDYVLVELFCADIGLAWSHGQPSGFVDNPAHTHAAIRPGAALPWPTPQPRRGEDNDER